MGLQITRTAPRAGLGRAFWEHLLKPENFVATRALPFVPVPEKNAKFSIVESAAMLRPEDIKRTPGAAFARLEGGTGELSYNCEQLAAEFKLPDEDRALLRLDLQADMMAINFLVAQLKIALEQTAASTLFNTTTWTGTDYFTDAATDNGPWDDGGASSTPVADVMAAKEKVRALTGIEPNAMIISAVQLKNLMNNSDIQEKIKYSSAVTYDNILNILPAVFGLDEILVGKGTYNSTAEGQTKSIGDIWSDDYAFVFVKAPEGADFVTPCVGRTFLWDDVSAGNGQIKTYREEGTHSTIYQVMQSVDQKIISADFGHLIKVDVTA